MFKNGKSLPEPIAVSQDLGWMLYDMDFSGKEPIPRFFRAKLDSGQMVIDEKEVRS